MEFPDWMQERELQGILEQLYAESGLHDDARIRLTIYRDGQGRFAPETNMATSVASIEQVEGNGFELNDRGIAIEYSSRFSQNPISNLQS